MVVIRLARVGKKKQPEYRIVVADKRRAATGRFIDIIGHYNPLTDPARVTIDGEKFMEWLAKGAQPSDTVRRLYDRDQKGEEIRNKPKNRTKHTPTPVAETPEAPAEGETVLEETPAEEAPVTDAATEEVIAETADSPEEPTEPAPEAKSDLAEAETGSAETEDEGA